MFGWSFSNICLSPSYHELHDRDFMNESFLIVHVVLVDDLDCPDLVSLAMHAFVHGSVCALA
jgi:hypothetical protein